MHPVDSLATASDSLPASINAGVAEHLRQLQQNEAMLRAVYRRKYTRAAGVFVVLQTLFCLSLMAAWIHHGYYVAGPVFAVNIWGLLCLAIPGVDLLLTADKQALAEAEQSLLRARRDRGQNWNSTQAQAQPGSKSLGGHWHHSRK